VNKRLFWIPLASLCLVLLPVAISAQQYDPALYQDLHWRSIGPFRAGRTVAIPGSRASLIGLVAGCLTTVAFVPQLLKIYATKSGRDVSARMFLIFSLGVVLWLVYGLRIRSAPVVFANLFTLVLSIVILALKFRYGRRERQVEPSADPG